jgi:cytochrome P450
MTTSPTDYRTLARYPSRDIGHIPGDKGLPLLGDSIHFLRDFHGLAREKHLRYGPVHRVNALFQQTIVMLGPDANEAVLKDPGKCFSSSLAWNPTLDRIFPNGLMLKDFEEHKYDRKVLQAAFKRPAIESYLTAMSPQLASGIREWPREQGFSFYQHVKALLLNVAAGIFLGVDVSAESVRLNRSFISAVDATLALVRISIPGNAWSRGQRGRAYLEAFVRSHIQHKRESGDTDIFAQICRSLDDEGQPFSDQAIIDHVIFLLFAAHDTTTSTLCSIVYSLAKHRDWQEALREEYLSLGKKELDFEDLARLEKTALVFREALRMYPPLPAIPRRCIRETEILGHRIPVNAGVGLSPLFTHYMKDYWSEPERFDPERFSPQRGEHKRHNFQFIPFGGGAHKCLGLHFAEVQAKLFLFHFLRQCSVSVEPGYGMKYSIVPLSLPTDGLPVRLGEIRPR